MGGQQGHQQVLEAMGCLVCCPHPLPQSLHLLLLLLLLEVSWALCCGAGAL
jgi:hypothetical protein